MARKEKQPVHHVQMTDGKRAIIQQLLQEYDIETAEDIQDALENSACRKRNDPAGTEVFGSTARDLKLYKAYDQVGHGAEYQRNGEGSDHEYGDHPVAEDFIYYADEQAYHCHDCVVSGCFYRRMNLYPFFRRRGSPALLHVCGNCRVVFI